MYTDFEYQPTRAFRRDELPGLCAVMDGEIADESASAPPPDSQADRDLAFADSLDAQGRAEASRGRFRAARAFHEQAMELRRTHHGEADPRLLWSFTWLGELSYREGLVEEARWLLAQAHQIACKRFQPDDLQFAVTLHNLAVVARKAGDHVEATRLGEQALAIKVERLGWEHASVARTLCTLGNLARLTKRRRVALCYFDRARTIYEKTEGGVNAGLATALVGMARVHTSMGSKVSARFLLERALQIREAVSVPPAQSAGVRVLLSQVLDDDDRTAAHELVHAALDEYERHESARPELLEHLRGLARDHESRRKAAN
ncbi:tetratricopeptide repeat protein [Nannocystis pusilla]|uniref:Tetratricopeptide repeat protein n=1 Tax=Nannocystis pusilla TaxID=889268 RepID=A0ABS7U345_9BACT|nr:tetratricopeptide repeat protein [Nannocystis pusilla]MBZ5714849.1 tetratricopeptide repeat protein [Nannocystis pusilla]